MNEHRTHWISARKTKRFNFLAHLFDYLHPDTITVKLNFTDIKGVKTGLNIKYRNPSDVGADRIANAIAATHAFPGKNLIIIDFGTATTFCVINEQKAYLGGVILPGVRLSVDALANNTAKLPSVEIIKMKQVVGRSTIESIQSGAFYGAVGACRELIDRIKKEAFEGQAVVVLATGGFAALLDQQGIYDQNLPDLVLQGVRIAAEMNTWASQS